MDYSFVVVMVVVVIVWWSFRKTIRVWSSLAERVSDSRAKEVMITTIKTDAKTYASASEMLKSGAYTPDNATTEELDAFLFEGRVPEYYNSNADKK